MSLYLVMSSQFTTLPFPKRSTPQKVRKRWVISASLKNNKEEGAI